MQNKSGNINATYSIRVIPQDNAHEEEILDSISLFSFENEYIYNKEVSSDVDDIEVKIDDFPSNKEFYYVSVFATSLDNKESLAYKLVTIGEPRRREEIPESSTKYKVMMNIFFGAIGVLVLVLIIVIIRMKNQNAKLENEVEILKFNSDDDSDKKKGKKISLLGKDEEE